MKGSLSAGKLWCYSTQEARGAPSRGRIYRALQRLAFRNLIVPENFKRKEKSRSERTYP